MKRRMLAGVWICAFLLAVSAQWVGEAVAAQSAQPPGVSTAAERPKVSASFKAVMNRNPDIRVLVEKSIARASTINPDRKTNPVQSLNELYDFLDYTVTCMPWNIMPEERYNNFATKCEQSILYVYWLLDQPLEELKDKDLFYPSVEYLEPIYTWLTEYNNTWRDFLDSKASWKQAYLDMLLRDPSWNLDKGWYESPDHWHSFNEFFSRKLSGGDARPIAEPGDDSVVVSPADSLPQGVWAIDEDGMFYADPIQREDGVTIKDSTFVSVEQLLGEPGAEYAALFHDGILTHTYLNYDDYHRYHFPVSGVVEAVYKIPYANAVGGIVYWDEKKGLYVLESNSLSWQSVETRGCVLIRTAYGMVAVIPVGMGQVSSVNFLETVKPGTEVKKGDELGYFLFGGSDCVMLFEGSSGFRLTVGKGEKGGSLDQRQDQVVLCTLCIQRHAGFAVDDCPAVCHLHREI